MLAPGDLLKQRYRILKKMESAMFSTSWLIWDEEKKMFHTAKIFQTSGMGYYYFKLEKDALGIIQSIGLERPLYSEEFILKMRDFINAASTSEPSCLILDVFGWSLNILKRKKWDISKNEVKEIAKSLFRCIEFLHEKCEVAHGNIYPGNIILASPETNLNNILENVESLAMDFDYKPLKDYIGYMSHFPRKNNFVVKLKDVLEASPKGPVIHIDESEYQSPESLLDLGNEDMRPADIWSAACCLFEIATGDKLFYSKENGSRSVLLSISRLLGPLPLKMKKTMCAPMEAFRPDDTDYLNPNLTLADLVQVALPESWSDKERQDLIDLLQSMLELECTKRADIRTCINHNWLKA